MSYRNKTYVIFDGDNDMWAYAFMKGWKENERMDFNFFDAHDIKPLTDRASDETIKERLRERMANARQVIVLVGEYTKNLYKFVRWEIELALRKDLPIIVVNLNNLRQCDTDLCPSILVGEYVVHVPFRLKIIQHALDHFPDEHSRRDLAASGPREYNASTYRNLGL